MRSSRVSECCTLCLIISAPVTMLTKRQRPSDRGGYETICSEDDRGIQALLEALRSAEPFRNSRGFRGSLFSEPVECGHHCLPRCLDVYRVCHAGQHHSEAEKRHRRTSRRAVLGICVFPDSPCRHDRMHRLLRGRWACPFSPWWSRTRNIPRLPAPPSV